LLEIDPEAAKELQDKLLKNTYKERMTLRHKKFGKWAQYAEQSKNPTFKQDLQDHYDTGKKLREKIDRIDSESSQSESDEDKVESSSSEDIPHKGIMKMKFMQRALQKQKEEYKQLKEEMMNEDLLEKKFRKKNQK